MSSLSPKLIELICEGLFPGYPETQADISQPQRHECQTTLARLARVSRAFFGPALDVLWRCVDEVHLLLYPLEAYDRETKMLTDAISEEQWGRFQQYARRVRALRLGAAHHIKSAVWVLLAGRCAHAPLLPRLEQLLGFTVSSDTACCTALFAPTLRRLELQFPGVGIQPEASTLRFVVQAAQPALASARRLLLHFEATSAVEDQPVRFWTLSQLRRLDVLHEVALTAELVQSLAAFPHLESLNLKIHDIPQGVRAHGFTALRELTLVGRLEHISTFIGGTALQSLESLAIEAVQLCSTADTVSRSKTDSATPPFTQKLLHPIYAALTPALRRFRATFSCKQYCAASSGHFPVAKEVFEPLRGLSGLRSISLAFHLTPFMLTDDSLAALSEAWPELVAFEVTVRAPPKYNNTEYREGHYRRYSRYSHDGDYEFESERRRSITRSPVHTDPPPPPALSTVKTLAAFAQGHPGLRRLAVPSLDLDALPDLDTVPLLGHRLEHLGISTLDADKPLADIALALDMLFPELDLADARSAAPARDNRSGELRLLLFMLKEGRAGRYRQAAAERPRAVSDMRLDTVARGNVHRRMRSYSVGE